MARKYKKIDPEIRKAFYKALFENSTHPVVILNPLGKIIEINAAVTRVAGYTRKDMIGKHFSKIGLLTKDSLKTALKNFVLEIRGKGVEPYDLEVITKNKNIIITRITPSPVRIGKKLEAIIAHFEIVTEQRMAEKALKQSEEKYRSLTEDMTDIVFTANAKGVITYMSPRVKSYGFKEKDIVNKSFLKYIHPNDKPRIINDFARTIKTGAEFISEFRIVNPKGRVIWFEEKSKIILNEKKEVVGISGVLRDVNDHKKSDNFMLMLSKALEQERDGVVVTDLKRKVLFVNKSWLKTFSQKITPGNPIDKYFTAKDKHEYNKLIKVLDLQTSMVRGIKCRNVKNEKMPCLLTITKLKNDDGQAFAILHVFVDISEQTKYEKTLKDANKKLERALRNVKSNEAKLKQQFEITRRLNRHMVGRELRMKELKVRIKELEKDSK